MLKSKCLSHCKQAQITFLKSRDEEKGQQHKDTGSDKHTRIIVALLGPNQHG